MAEALFSRMLSAQVVRSIALQGLQIYVLGNKLDLNKDASAVEPLSDVVLAISLRGPGGVWPPPRPLLQDALRLCIEDIHSPLVPPECDEYHESLMLLYLLLGRCDGHADGPDRRGVRLLWLEEPEIAFEPQSEAWACDPNPDHCRQLLRSLASCLEQPSKTPSLQYCGMHEMQPTVRDAQWLPVGPLADGEIALNLGDKITAEEESLRFAIKEVTGSDHVR